MAKILRATASFGMDFGTPCAEKITGFVVSSDLVELLDENRALGLQPFNDIFVVDDFMTDIDGRAMNAQRFLDSVDGAHDARAKTARRAQKHMELWLYGHAATDPGINPFRCTTVRLSSPPRELPFPQTLTGRNN